MSKNQAEGDYFTMSLHIVTKVLLKRMQNCVNVLVAKLCFSSVPVSCGKRQNEEFAMKAYRITYIYKKMFPKLNLYVIL